MACIAVIVHSKNEDDLIRFATVNKPLFSSAKLVITRTEKNKFESLFDKKIVSPIASLELKGDSIIAAKARRGELTAVFYFSPQPDATAGLMELMTACIKKKIYFAINAETADCIFVRLTTGVCPKKKYFFFINILFKKKS